MLYHWNKHYGWDNSLSHIKLHRYPVFNTIINSILEYLDDRSLTVKSLDMGLWIIGKYVFRNRKNAGDDYVTEEFEKKIGKVESESVCFSPKLL